MTDLIGQRLGDYVISGVLGKGGMAAVYRARQQSVQRDVAIKVIKPDLTQSLNPEEFLARFRREAQTIANLSHPHILKLFDYGQAGEMLYLVMELLSGGTLADRLKGGRLNLTAAAKLLDQVAGGLDYAHKRGIVHRDLKPQNVLFDEEGNAFLSDFGIAKLLNEGTKLTGTGTALGTPAYMPPEQWQNRALDARADVYALGVLLFEALTGQMPFNADTPFQMMYAHVNERPRSLRGMVGTIPESIEAVILKALNKEREDRFQSAGAFAEAFRAALTGVMPVDAGQEMDRTARTPAGGIPAVIPTAMPTEDAPQPQRGGGRSPLTAGLVALVVVIGVIMILIGRGGNAPTTGTETAISTTPSAAAMNPTETTPPPATTTETPSSMATDAPTATYTATFRLEEIAAATLTAGAATRNVIQTATAGQRTVEGYIAAANATETAALWTYTPTPTNTFTTTFTPTPTNTFTMTFTPTPTNTYTRTFTPTATFTPSKTPASSVAATPTFIPAGAKVNWTVVKQAFDGVPMVLVPAGCFMMGSTTSEDEKPIHEVCLTKSFWIDQYEVSNAQFKSKGGQAKRSSNWTGSDLPRENITWFEARDFCTLRGARLPTEAEWEYAARGPQSLAYPWGNSFVADNMVYSNNSGDEPASVGSRPGGVSWIGAYDLSGNMWEWVADWYDSGYYGVSTKTNPQGSQDGNSRVLRGGSWINDEDYARAANRNWNIPAIEDIFVGFRCARFFSQ